MRKISFILALVFLLLALPSCSSTLEPVPAETKAEVTEALACGATAVSTGTKDLWYI